MQRHLIRQGGGFSRLVLGSEPMHKNGGIIGKGLHRCFRSQNDQLPVAARITIGFTGLGVSHAHQPGSLFKSVMATAAAYNFRHRLKGSQSFGL